MEVVETDLFNGFPLCGFLSKEMFCPETDLSIEMNKHGVSDRSYGQASLRMI